MNFTQEEVEKMDKETALVEVENAVYQATALIEQLENAKKIYGNGHHIRQSICNNARKLLKERWLK